MDAELERLLQTVSGYFALLAEPTRLKILNAQCEAERNASDIVAHTGATQTTVSRHLNLVYSRGVLDRRRESAIGLYSIADQNVVELCRSACVRIASMADEKAVPSKVLR